MMNLSPKPQIPTAQSRQRNSPRFYGLHNLHKLPQFSLLTPAEQRAVQVVGNVLPFRVNQYVVDELIDWSRVPDDPFYQLTFPQREMLADHHFRKLADLLPHDGGRHPVQREAREMVHAIRMQLNPHPAGQLTANVPDLDDAQVAGLQHKYRETCLVFPSKGQTCHAYCTFCFRWPQFVGMDGLKFATDESRRFQEYLARHPEVTDVLFTGGDPMVMSARNLSAYIEPLLGKGFEHIQNIRIGTKSLGYWPYRFVTDPDADKVLRLFERIVQSGKHLALMAHVSHGRELSTDVAQQAISRIRSTGAEIRTQSPLIKHVNDDPAVWEDMWRTQVKLGCIPYYMFVERDTGAKHYFAVPLARAWRIFQGAYQRVSGLARTVRGPSMSAYPGKVCVDGIATVGDEEVFVLSFLQAREADFVKRPFFARFDESATWLSDLVPAMGAREFFFERPNTGHVGSMRHQSNGSIEGDGATVQPEIVERPRSRP